MKTLLQVMVWMLLAAVGGAYGAAPAARAPGVDLVGQWRGSLAADPKTKLTIQFDIARRPDEGYIVVLDSPDTGAIKNTPASKVTFAGGRLQFEVPSLQGAYSGTLANGVLTGEWKQSTGVLPLNLTPYQPPQLSKAAVDGLKGTWVGPLEFSGVKLTMVLAFKPDDANGLSGTFRSPDQGGGEAPVTSIEFNGDRLTARVPAGAIDLNLKLAGDTLTGFLKQPGMPGDGAPLTMKRGEYVAPVFSLASSAEARKQLAGQWSGQLSPPANAPPGTPATPRRIVVSFRTNDKDQFVGAIEFPDPPKGGFPIQDLLLNGSELTLKAGPGGALQYTAHLAGRTLTGDWTAGPFKVPLVLTRN